MVLGLGVRPSTELARAAGLPLGAAGGVLTDRADEGLWLRRSVGGR
ncbi:MAG: hypothetical protein ACT4NY_05950 [Pseudonocardiales bacterium]